MRRVKDFSNPLKKASLVKAKEVTKGVPTIINSDSFILKDVLRVDYYERQTFFFWEGSKKLLNTFSWYDKFSFGDKTCISILDIEKGTKLLDCQINSVIGYKYILKNENILLAYWNGELWLLEINQMKLFKVD